MSRPEALRGTWRPWQACGRCGAAGEPVLHRDPKPENVLVRAVCACGAAVGVHGSEWVRAALEQEQRRARAAQRARARDT